jgi:hypothetical protein
MPHCIESEITFSGVAHQCGLVLLWRQKNMYHMLKKQYLHTGLVCIVAPDGCQIGTRR